MNPDVKRNSGNFAGSLDPKLSSRITSDMEEWRNRFFSLASIGRGWARASGLFVAVIR